MPRGSKRIRDRRHQLGLTQSQLASDAEVSLRTIQLAEAGKSSLRANTMHRIAEALDLDYDSAVVSETPSPDNMFSGWPWSLSRFIQGSAAPGPHARCRSRQDARFAIRSMRTDWRRAFDPATETDGELDFDTSAGSPTEQVTGSEHRYLRIWETNPDTLRFCTVDQRRAGLCVMLPVTSAAYKDLRRGRRSIAELQAGEILPASQNLVLDSVVEFPGFAAEFGNRLTTALGYTLFYQLALLSLKPGDADFRMLGFATSPLHRQRLADMGFSSIEANMPKAGGQILEFTAQAEDRPADVVIRASTTTHCVSLFKRFSLQCAVPQAQHQQQASG